jgi:hypothetical protein
VVFFDWTRKFGIKAKIRNARLYRQQPASGTQPASDEGAEEAAQAAENSLVTIQPQKDADIFRAGGVASFMNEYGIILSFVRICAMRECCD